MCCYKMMRTVRNTQSDRTIRGRTNGRIGVCAAAARRKLIENARVSVAGVLCPGRTYLPSSHNNNNNNNSNVGVLFALELARMTARGPVQRSAFSFADDPRRRVRKKSAENGGVPIIFACTVSFTVITVVIVVVVVIIIITVLYTQALARAADVERSIFIYFFYFILSRFPILKPAFRVDPSALQDHPRADAISAHENTNQPRRAANAKRVFPITHNIQLYRHTAAFLTTRTPSGRGKRDD